MANINRTIARRIVNSHESDAFLFTCQPEYEGAGSYAVIRQAAGEAISKLPREALMVLIWNADVGYESLVPGTEWSIDDRPHGKPGRWWMRRHALAAVLHEIRAIIDERIEQIPA